MPNKKSLYFAIAYTLFIVYGSLVPLNYRPIPLEQAFQSFQQIPYLNLGVASRADWVANIILYIPLTFLFATFFGNLSKSRFLTFLFSLLILFFSITLAITIEFYQQFFPPRTVSQNDLIAETIGSLIGLTLWFSNGNKLLSLVTRLTLGGKNALIASASLYILGYLFISFFPYDFITSHAEFNAKLLKGHDAFFVSNSCGGAVRCTSKLVSEIVLALPIGLFFSFIFKWHPQRLAAVLLIGLIIGIIIEAVQLFLISGIAQGMSIITRVIGMALGERLYQNIDQLNLPRYQFRIKKIIIFATIPYILLVASLNGWSVFDNQLTFDIEKKIYKINWLPFYYHYYTTEAVALRSLLNHFMIYLPIGFGLWLWHNNDEKQAINRLSFSAGLIASTLCFLIESSKLFLLNKHPDPTNLLISFLSAYVACTLVHRIFQWFQQPEVDFQSKETHPKTPVISTSYKNEAVNQSVLSEVQTGSYFAKFVSISIITLLLWKTINYPVFSGFLAGLLIIYGLILNYRPQFWLIAIPTLLPILNLAPWSGRFFFSEFDYLILVTLAIALWHGRWQWPFRQIKPATLLIFLVYSFFYLISLIKGLLPIQNIDINAFNNYYSQYNSLRVSKGFYWALFLLPLLTYNFQHQKNNFSWFSYGILSGLSATVLFSFWERYIFTGLFDYDSDFRITSRFFSMHTGGAHLDAYLILSIPFVFFLLTRSKSNFFYPSLALILFSGSLYSLMVTFSRGAYIAFIITFLTFLLSLFFCYKQELKNHWKKALWLPLFGLIFMLIATPILKGDFIKNRFNQAYQEVDIRSAHWKNTYGMMDSDLFTLLTGMGLGSFPRTFFWKHLDKNTPATYRIVNENQQNYLKLGTGAPLYLEQIINTTANTSYQLKLDYRIYSSTSHINIQLCEKAIQHSFNCQKIMISPEKSINDWQHFEHTIKTNNTSYNKNPFTDFTKRPIKLVLSNSQEQTIIDITNISLAPPGGNQLIKNGNFFDGMDHWFFSADDHLPWRTENQWIQILFEQGWIEIILFTLFLLNFFIHLYQQLIKQNIDSVIILSSFTGFLVITIIDSPFDMPRITLLFFLLIFISLLNDRKDINLG